MDERAVAEEIFYLVRKGSRDPFVVPPDSLGGASAIGRHTNVDQALALPAGGSSLLEPVRPVVGLSA